MNILLSFLNLRKQNAAFRLLFRKLRLMCRDKNTSRPLPITVAGNGRESFDILLFAVPWGLRGMLSYEQHHNHILGRYKNDAISCI